MDKGNRENGQAPARPLPIRWYVMRTADMLARLWPVPRQRRGALVVIADCGLGDVVLAHAAISRYPEFLQMPPGAITLVGTGPAASLAPLIFSGMAFRQIDEIAFHRNPIYRLRFALWIRRHGFAVAICGSFMRKPMVCDALIDLSDAPRRVIVQPHLTSKSRRIFEAYLRRCPEIVDGGPYPTAEILRHIRVLAAVANSPVPLTPPRLSWERRGVVGLPERYAVIAAGASSMDKCWPLENFLRVAEFLYAGRLPVVFIGGPTDDELKRRLADADRDGRFIDLVGETPLRVLFDVLARASLVIANDTGPAHIAIALERPTVVILGGGHFGANFPYPNEATPPNLRVLYHELPCFHCSWHCTQPRAAERSVPCIDAVSLPEVLAAAERCLSLDA